MTDNEAAAVSPELIEAAKQLLADTMGWPVKSDTEMDLSDRDQVFTDVAVLAVAKALNSTRSPVLSDEAAAMCERLLDADIWVREDGDGTQHIDGAPIEAAGLIARLIEALLDHLSREPRHEPPAPADEVARLRAALRECSDKLWVLRCNSRDDLDRKAAEYACDMADRALRALAASPPREETDNG
jgi:hypothetical protein